jgi:hypothetical protein
MSRRLRNFLFNLASALAGAASIVLVIDVVLSALALFGVLTWRTVSWVAIGFVFLAVWSLILCIALAWDSQAKKKESSQ